MQILDRKSVSLLFLMRFFFVVVVCFVRLFAFFGSGISGDTIKRNGLRQRVVEVKHKTSKKRKGGPNVRKSDRCVLERKQKKKM